MYNYIIEEVTSLGSANRELLTRFNKREKQILQSLHVGIWEFPSNNGTLLQAICKTISSNHDSLSKTIVSMRTILNLLNTCSQLHTHTTIINNTNIILSSKNADLLTKCNQFLYSPMLQVGEYTGCVM